ncbi:Phage-related minor tail protein [Leifsonia sp. 98AMF]|uniref:phage tail tape measure protein n=1 Tax=unclassified Leifsonia TaxID=2663824 RepID=UPI00087B8D39|nr:MULTISPECIES: phage tail tape measure protein [unclassified Leifsonia]SDH16210.1 Phage-related minor tail protein [Leifsonia sp. 197AMF]SDJ22077.1 Phage-related minor tail protein [Leifsonia sp. 466MF]SDK61685.1 Phage-related minor tail protein [Leifsonia sp. 157MF]SDN43755.1 Phage-related minor tail protein [Leifsonia sp. 509MF]SEN67352.1 Phage-related minor tail protein [Leifsonia sp. 467MF]
MGKTAILAIRIIGDATDAVAGFGEAEKAGKSFEDSMGKLKGGMQLAGAAAGAALAAGVYGAVENAQDHNRLTAQLGLDPAESERLGGIAGKLYADAYGDSLATVNEAIRGVESNIAGMGSASDAELESVTGKVLSLSSAFDQDLGATTTAVGQLMRTGMAKDASEALDIITKGLQSNARAGEDLLDTFTEYPALFQRLGLDGETATGLINQGLAAGARNTDVVADALKEFQIRATDGSKTSAAGFEALGLDAAEATARIARGGGDAAAGLDDVLDRLRGMTDPVAQNAAAVALFGTKAEDLGGALFALDPSSAVDALGQVAGAADALDGAMSKDQEFEKLQRTVTQTFTDIGAAALPVITPILDGLREFAPILGPLAVVLTGAGAAVTVISGAMKVFAAVQAVQTAAQWANNAAWLASPITWIILAILAAIALVIAIVVLLVQHWDEVQKVAGDVWGFVLDTIKNVGDWFRSVFEAIGLYWDYLVGSWSDGFESFVGWIREAIKWLGDLVAGAIPGWVKDLLGMNQTFTARLVVDEPTVQPAMLAFSAAEAVEGFSFRTAAVAAPTTVASMDAGAIAGSGKGKGGGDTYVNVEFNGLVTDPEGVAREIRKVLNDSDKANGRTIAAGGVNR